MRTWLIALAAMGVAALVDGGGASYLRGEDPSPSRPQWQRLLQGDDARKAEELQKRFDTLLPAGKFDEALASAEELARLRQDRQGKEHWQAVNARFAVEALRLALRSSKKNQDDYAASFDWQSRADSLRQKGRHREALPLLEQVRAIYRKVLGEEHPDTATCYNNVAFVLNAQGRYQEAEEGFQKALAIQRKVLGEEHPSTATSYDNLARNLNAQGRYQEAEEIYQKALAIRRKVLGEEHPSTASSYNNVAHNLNAQGRYKEAQEIYQKALAIRRKVLGEEHPDTATSYNNVAHNLNAQSRYQEAQEIYQKALAIRRKVLGEEHPDTASSYNNVAFNQQAQGRYQEAEEGFQKALAISRKVLGEEHPDTATSYNNVAFVLNAQGRYKEAQQGFQKALDITRKVLGENHPDTATSYNNVAFVLNAQGRYKEAEEAFQKALDILRKVLGEEHPSTATGYNNVAFNLKAQGRYKEAEASFQKALAIFRKVVGDEHRSTATCYNNLASSLDAQGRYKEAQQGFQKALDITRKVLGEEHPDTATSYHNAALNLDAQGRYKEAEEVYQKALAIYRKVLGEEHPDTAISYNNLASSLDAQGRYKEAEEAYQKALAIQRKVLGEEHPDTATGYNNVAGNRNAQGRYKEAEEGYQKALAIFRKVLGEEHPDTAGSYNNVAFNLNAQGRYKEAEAGFHKALAIRRKVLGEQHPDTALSCHNVALNLYAQGRYQEAEEVYSRAARAFLSARLQISASGLGRITKTSEHSPLPRLACVLARNGKTALAWQRYEESLSRGTWDDLAARLRRPPAERARQADLVARLQRLDQLIEKALAVKEETPEQKKAREDLLGQRRQAQEDLDAFARHLEAAYGPAAGAVADVSRIQAALGEDMALLGWLDIPPTGPKAADPNGEHWAFLLRSKGEPVCVRLKGSGAGGAWTEDDSELPTQLRTSLLEHRGDWQRLARRLREQRLEPLRSQLGAQGKLPAVKRLVVLPSPALAGVPLEVLVEDLTISYALSGTLHAHLKTQPAVKGAGLLALGDPIFETAPAPPKDRPLPPGGLLLTLVQPGSNAALAGLKPNDVLLTYGETELKDRSDLKPDPASDDEGKRIGVSVWRDGKIRELRIRPGKLGVVLASEPAPKVLAETSRLDRILRSRSGDDGWTPLPGTRVEVESLQRLFAAEPKPLLLFDSEASEQKFDALAAAGELGRFRYLHLATHGDVDNSRALRSAIILSRDSLPDPQEQLLSGKPVYDGRLTAEEMLRSWNLEAELVTLSACQTALGKYERGEGFVGFAQALILCGSRSVCLSLWKVDDAATALLMQRFYANLLGKREGLKAPLPKAEALAEAKRWLRTLPREQALKQAAALYQGIERSKGRPKLPVVPHLPNPMPEAKEDCPYAHPYYWAAFILTGDPD
jgi:tetratricopeptide (TPR) repeat protein